MTEAGWTREKPTEPGWYWWRTHAKDGKPWVIKVQRLDRGMMQMWRIGCDSPVIIGEGGEWLGPITPDSYQQGRVAALDEVERYMAMRLRLAEASLATEILAGNEVKQGRERAAIAELHGVQRHVSDIKEYNAQ